MHVNDQGHHHFYRQLISFLDCRRDYHLVLEHFIDFFLAFAPESHNCALNRAAIDQMLVVIFNLTTITKVMYSRKEKQLFLKLILVFLKQKTKKNMHILGSPLSHGGIIPKVVIIEQFCLKALNFNDLCCAITVCPSVNLKNLQLNWFCSDVHWCN